MRKVAALLVASISVAGCVGAIGGDDEHAPEPVDCAAAAVSSSPVRRLTRWEYDNTVADLLGDKTAPAASFLPESLELGFTNGAASTPMSALVVEDLETAALALAANAVKAWPAFLGCDVASKGEVPCTGDFVDRFGKRAFRRPLTQAEHDAFVAFVGAQKGEFGFQKAIEMLVAALLQSPTFLYRVEIGMPAPDSEKALRLTGFETATRLSYLLWGSMPDDALLASAEAGELDTSDGVRARADKMLADPRGARSVQDYYLQWGKLAGLDHLQKDAPEFTPAIAADMLTETRAFVDDVVRNGDGLYSTLLLGKRTFLNQELATFYGLTGPKSSTFEPVDLDASRASGFLTQGALMATLAHGTLPSEVYRGKFIMEQVLCAPLPPPPDNVNTQLPSPDPMKTQRQQLEELTKGEPCHDCHGIMNPPGFAFDHYDAVGRWRDTDNGKPIDTTGDLEGPGDATGHFNGLPDLAALLAKSEAVRTCAVESWFHYAYGRAEADQDHCSMNQLQDLFEKSGGNVKTLLLELTQTPAFLYRVRPGAGP